MPYIKQELRNEKTFIEPTNRGELNWAITVRLLNVFETTHKGYSDHVEMRAIISEILQAAQQNIDLSKVAYVEFREQSREVMEEIDNLWWDYIASTNDVAGAKQVLDDVRLEWYRRATAPYEARKIQENGDIYSV